MLSPLMLFYCQEQLLGAGQMNSDAFVKEINSYALKGKYQFLIEMEKVWLYESHQNTKKHCQVQLKRDPDANLTCRVCAK